MEQAGESVASEQEGMVATPEGGFIVDDEYSGQGDEVAEAGESEALQDVEEKMSAGKTEESQQQKKLYKSSKFGEVPEDVVEKLLSYKDRVQDLEKIEDIEKFRAEIQTAANKKFMAAKKEREEVAQEREAARSILDYAKSNPMEFLQATGVDLNQIVRSRLEEDMRLAQMNPEQRQEYARAKEMERRNQEMQQKLQTYEQQMRQHQEQQTKAERAGRFNELARMIAQVHKEANLPESLNVVETIMGEMQAAAKLQEETGLPISSSKLMKNIKSRLYTDALKLIGSAKSYDELSEYDKGGGFRDALMKLAAGYATKNRTLASSQQKEGRSKPRAVEAPARSKDEPLFIGDADIRRMKLRGEW